MEPEDILEIEEIPPGKHSGRVSVTGRPAAGGGHELGIDFVLDDGMQFSLRIELGGESAGPLARDIASRAQSKARWDESIRKSGRRAAD